MENTQFERLISVLEDIAYNLEELKGQFEVTNRLSTDTTGNILSELVWALEKKFETDMNNHLSKN